MRRVAVTSLICFVAAGCNATDAAVGVHAGADENPAAGAITATSVLSRVDLGTLGGASSYAADVNNNTTVVGWSATASGASHAFRWNATDGMVDLGTLPGDVSSRAVAIIDGGPQGGEQILGVSSGNGQSTPVIWSPSGSIASLPIPLLGGFAVALPTDFNARGDVVGSDAGSPGQHGWIWTSAQGKYDLSANVQGGSNEGSANAVNGSGVVLLTTRAFTCTQTPDCWRTYLWSGQSGYRALGTPGNDPEANVTGLGMNEGGVVVGWLTSNATSGASPYRWTAGAGFTVLSHYSTSGFQYGYAAAVNPSGITVGADFESSSGSIVASAWLANGTIVRLSPSDPNPSVAIAVNNTGVIAGWAATTGGVNHAVIWKPSGQASTATLVAPSSVAAVRVSTASSSCLRDPRSIISRQALFACVIEADRKR